MPDKVDTIPEPTAAGADLTVTLRREGGKLSIDFAYQPPDGLAGARSRETALFAPGEIPPAVKALMADIFAAMLPAAKAKMGF